MYQSGRLSILPRVHKSSPANPKKITMRCWASRMETMNNRHTSKKQNTKSPKPSLRHRANQTLHNRGTEDKHTPPTIDVKPPPSHAAATCWKHLTSGLLAGPEGTLTLTNTHYENSTSKLLALTCKAGPDTTALNGGHTHFQVCLTPTMPGKLCSSAHIVRVERKRR